MPHKIGFTVTSWSGHEENYSAKQLMVHGPTVSGWRSIRFCPYPQEIILQLVERSYVRKVQLLAHQYLIPSRIEFHIGDCHPDSCSPQQDHSLHRLGHVSLSDNEKTGFKARELTTVHIDAVGTYLKLTLQKNHVNQYNTYNQIALIALNVLGDPLNGNDTGTSTALSSDHHDQYINSSLTSSSLDGTLTGQSISPFDDLMFDMYQDPEVANIIRLLDQRKQYMIQEERFDQAKILKQAIADLQKVGERLGQYDVEKHSAIEREDFDAAKQKKEEMDSYRLSVYQQLELHNLLGSSQKLSENLHSEVSSPCTETQKSTTPADSPSKRPDENMEKTENQECSKCISPSVVPTPAITTSPEIAKTHNATLPYDERPLPTQQRMNNPFFGPSIERHPLTESTTSGSPWTAGQLELHTDKVPREASQAIEIFGDGLVTRAYSRTWSHREEALVGVYKQLTDLSPETPKAELRSLTRAAVFLCKKALTDKVSSVVQASLVLLRMILSEFITQHHLGKSEISHCVGQTWNNLLSRTGDSNMRLRTLAVNFIQEMAFYPEVRDMQVVPLELVKPMPRNLPVKQVLSRLELLEKLLERLGTKDSGFTLENVMPFLIGALEHSAPAVRDVSVRVVQAMYRHAGKAVLKYLPPDDAVTRKNLLYKKIFDSLAKLDGRSQKPNRRIEGGCGWRYKEELKNPDQRLPKLKEMSVNEKEKHDVEAEADNSVIKKDHHSVSSDAKSCQSSTNNCLDNLCVFCGERDESFTEGGLDLHYWKHCPMLLCCRQCRKVVEISSLTEHLLSDCEHRAHFKECPLCSEALVPDKLAEHAGSAECNPPSVEENGSHCPLCHENFSSGEKGWKSHLMGPEGCKQNSRRRAAQGTQERCRAIANATWTESQGSARAKRLPAITSRTTSSSRIPTNKTYRLQPA